jgi:hypothetical protein
VLDIRTPAVIELVAEGKVPLDQLERDITELAAHIHAATCRWLLMLAEFIERGGWAVDGVQSPAHWLEWKCAIPPRAAREHVRVATTMKELPEVTKAFSEGRLSFSQVRAITRVATSEDEGHFVEISRYTTAGQLEKVIRAYRGVRRDQELDAAHQRHADRSCDWRYADDGSLIITAKLPPEDGAKIIAALEAAAEQIDDESGLGEPGEVAGEGPRVTTDSPGELSFQKTGKNGSAEPQRHNRRRLRGGTRAADALLMMAERSQCAGKKPRSGADRTTVTLHVDVDSLLNDGGELCDIDGTAVPAETARRLSCDARIVTILEKEGEPLKLGRRTRTVTVAQRRALEARDGCCVFPGCTNTGYVDAHHIDHWIRGGETDVDRMALLCWIHHRLMHEGGFKMERRSDGSFVFYRPDGDRVPDVEGMAPAVGPGLDWRNAAVGLDIDSETCVTEWDGSPLRYDLVVGSILHPDGAWF